MGDSIMFDRKTYKANGKQAFQRNYWLCVAVALIVVMLCDGVLSGMFTLNDIPESDKIIEYYEAYQYGSIDYEMEIYDVPQQSKFVAKLPTIFSLLGIFVFSIFDVGGCRFFIKNSAGDGQFADLISGFKDGYYWDYVWALFAMKLQSFLWGLLFIVPGIVKAYEYAMVPYIVADNPGMDKKTAFAVSKQLMTGNKWNLFVFDLSFLGWTLLSAITFNIVGVFYAYPYMKASRAEVYLALKAGLAGSWYSVE